MSHTEVGLLIILVFLAFGLFTYPWAKSKCENPDRSEDRLSGRKEQK